MRKLVVVVLVLSLAFCFWGHKTAMAQSNDAGPCDGHQGQAWLFREALREPEEPYACYFYVTCFCCDGTIEQYKDTYHWGCPEGCCACEERHAPCGMQFINYCDPPNKCTSAVNGETTETGCHYVINNYDCEGNYTGQTETDTGSPPDGLTCCDAVPPDQCPAKQQVEYPAGSGNFYCKCGKVTWYDSEPWRQGMPSPPPPDTP